MRTLKQMMKDAGEVGLPDCDTLEEAAAALTLVRPPSEIEYRIEGKFPRMIRRTFGEMHVRTDADAPSDFDDIVPYDAQRFKPRASITPPPPRSSSDIDSDDIPF
jgi:hypothetical protein